MKYQKNRSAEVRMPMMLETAIISISTSGPAELKSRQSRAIDFGTSHDFDQHYFPYYSIIFKIDGQLFQWYCVNLLAVCLDVRMEDIYSISQYQEEISMILKRLAVGAWVPIAILSVAKKNGHGYRPWR